jgi:hypothetical protein
MAGRFWTDTAVEPKRKFRWLFEFAGMPQFIVTKVAKPSFTVSAKEHSFLDYQFQYPGKVKWEDVSFTIVDPVQPDSAKTFFKVLTNSGYVLPNNFMTQPDPVPRTITKKQMVESLGNRIFLKQLGADPGNGSPVVVEQWEIINPILTKVTFGDLDYGTEDLVTIDVALKYDWAELDLNVGPGTVFPISPGAASPFSI